jgi:hypothetical protein
MSAAMTIDLPKPDFAKNMRLIGHSEIGGRGDGLQVMVHKGYAYVAHPWSQGFSIVDVRDPKNPGETFYIPSPENTWTIHLQTHDNLLLVVNALDLFADTSKFPDEKTYYTLNIGDTVGTSKDASGKRPWTAGMTVYDISNPTQPRQIGFMPVNGVGIHRIWYTGGRWAYVSALVDGFTDYIFMTIDMSDPTKPVEAGRWWLPGMNAAAGEVSAAPAGKRFALHHALVDGDTAYACWRDGGLTILDVADRSKPQLIKHHNWAPPYGGGTHSPLPLPKRDLLIVADEAVLDHEEDGRKLTWVFDIREKSNPISISTFPHPNEVDYVAKGGHFGPHNLHENRPGSFQSDTLIFAAYQNAGIRAFDITDAYAPKEVGALVPAAPRNMTDKRPGRPQVTQSADLFVDSSGIIYATDNNGGLSIIEYLG